MIAKFDNARFAQGPWVPLFRPDVSIDSTCQVLERGIWNLELGLKTPSPVVLLVSGRVKSFYTYAQLRKECILVMKESAVPATVAIQKSNDGTVRRLSRCGYLYEGPGQGFRLQDWLDRKETLLLI